MRVFSVNGSMTNKERSKQDGIFLIVYNFDLGIGILIQDLLVSIDG